MKQWQCGQVLRLQSVYPIPVGCYCCNCENSSESDKLLVNERDSECHKAGWWGNSELILLGEIDDELDEESEVDYDEVCEVREAMSDDELDQESEVDYDEVCEVREADEWWWAGWGEWGWLWWGLWGQRGWWVSYYCNFELKFDIIQYFSIELNPSYNVFKIFFISTQIKAGILLIFLL